MRPSTRSRSRNSFAAVASKRSGWANTGPTTVVPTRASTPTTGQMMRARNLIGTSMPPWGRRAVSRRLPSERERLAVGRLPAPGARAVAALEHALFVDLRDDLAVAGQQRLRPAHLGAERQLAFGKAVRAVFLVLGDRAVGLGSGGAVGAFIHLAARAEVADARVLRRAE